MAVKPSGDSSEKDENRARIKDRPERHDKWSAEACRRLHRRLVLQIRKRIYTLRRCERPLHVKHAGPNPS